MMAHVSVPCCSNSLATFFSPSIPRHCAYPDASTWKKPGTDIVDIVDIVDISLTFLSQKIACDSIETHMLQRLFFWFCDAVFLRT